MAASVLVVALERQAWSLAALCLLLGVAEEAASLPPDALAGLLELLEVAPRGRRRR